MKTRLFVCILVFFLTSCEYPVYYCIYDSDGHRISAHWHNSKTQCEIEKAEIIMKFKLSEQPVPYFECRLEKY